MPEPTAVDRARTLLFGTGYAIVARSELAQLRNDSRRLAALEAGGVDNWGGYDDAIAALADHDD